MRIAQWLDGLPISSAAQVSASRFRSGNCSRETPLPLELSRPFLNKWTFILVLVSPNSINSRWVQSELNETLSRELQTRAITVIPALIEDCTMPPPLANLVYLDLRTDLEGGIGRLIQQLGMASDIDFSRLNPQSFESLVADLLQRLGFSIEHQALSSDSGFDFKASFPTRGSFWRAP